MASPPRTTVPHSKLGTGRGGLQPGATWAWHGLSQQVSRSLPSLPEAPMKPAAERFSDRVDDYVRYRPGYPAAVLDLLEQECGLAPGSVVADVGAGTGIF